MRGVGGASSGGLWGKEQSQNMVDVPKVYLDEITLIIIIEEKPFWVTFRAQGSKSLH